MKTAAQPQRETKVQVTNRSLSKINKQDGTATDEQKIYSTVLSAGRKLGLASIIIALGAYLSGLMKPKVPVNILPHYWSLSSGGYMKATGLTAGWSWFNMYRYGDMLNYFGIAILGFVSVACYLSIIPTLARKKDTAYFIIAIAEVLVLVLAASGIVNIGE